LLFPLSFPALAAAVAAPRFGERRHAPGAVQTMRVVKDILAARASGNPGCPFCFPVADKEPLKQVRKQFRVHGNSHKPILAGFAS